MVRLKHRYLLLQLLYPAAPSHDSDLHEALIHHAPTPDSLTPAIFSRQLRDAVSDLFGDYGAGLTASSLNIKYLSNPTSTAIVRVSRRAYRLVWAAVTLGILRLPDSKSGGKGVDVVVRVVRVCGTIKKAEEELIRRGREMLLLAKKGKGAALSYAAGPVDVDMPDAAGALAEDSDADL